MTHSFLEKCRVRGPPLLLDRHGAPVRSGRAGGGPQEAAGPCEEPDLPTRLLLPVLHASFGLGQGWGAFVSLCCVVFVGSLVCLGTVSQSV